MKLNEGLLIRTGLDEENIIFLEKVIEGFCHYICIFKQIAFLVPEKNSEGVIAISSIRATGKGGIEINEGECIKYESCPEIKNVLENNRGVYIREAEQEGACLLLPVGKNRKTPFCVIKLNGGDYFDENDFLANIRDSDFVEEIYDKCFSNFSADAYFYIRRDGAIDNVNLAAEAFKQRIKASETDWFYRLWESRESSLMLNEIIDERLCTGVDFKINQFEFFIILYPLYIAGNYQGMLICIADVSMIKNMLKQVINKSTVIKEVHHRVKNNLQTIASLLRLQMRRTNSYMIEKAFVEGINRISSIALVYEALSHEGENVVNMRDCIRNIMAMIISNMVEPGKMIKGEIRGTDIYLSSHYASNLSLCLTELLQNAVQHAFVFRKNGNIIVTLNQVNREIFITVEDDGVGLSGKKAKGNSLGLQIINMITTETLKGSFKLESHTYGAKAEIRFPI